jgi:hypothetical protein
VLLIVAIAALLIGGVWYLLHRRFPENAIAVAPAASGGAQVVLRMHGSNTIGAQLAPALAQAFFPVSAGGSETILGPLSFS